MQSFADWPIMEKKHNELIRSVVIPDIIFMDINVPLMNGIECLCALINIPRTSHIPVIVLSTEVDQ